MTEEAYTQVAAYQDAGEYSEREKLAIEFAERFALNHTSMDEAFFGRLGEAYSDEEVLDLTVCAATFLGVGRATKILRLDQDD